jgi:hypothetical protein
MKQLMEPQHRGKAFPTFSTVFIGRNADLTTWFHELAHIVYPTLLADEKAGFAASIKQHASIVTMTGTETVRDPKTGGETVVAPGKYLVLDGRLIGIDHSGADQEAMDDECWAAIFGLGFTKTPVPIPIADVFDSVIARLRGSVKDRL